MRSPAGWLVLLFLGETVTATAMGSFEEEISQGVVLPLFVPPIISNGGNSGFRTASLIIRAMAIAEAALGGQRVTRRVVLAGYLPGSLPGVIGSLKIFLGPPFTNPQSPHRLLSGKQWRPVSPAW